MFNTWIKILKQVDNSILWLFEDNYLASTNLRQEAKLRGLNPDRIVFAQRMELADHLARHKVADLFLDTFPYNAHTTASDALWVGLPILTIKGNTFPGRVSASLLNSLRLNELVVENFEDYESAAMEIALNKEKLLSINKKLENNIESFYLFDADHYVKKYEDALLQIQNRFVNGLGSDHIFVV